MSIPCGPPWPASKTDARNAIIRWRKAISPAERRVIDDQIAIRIRQRLVAYLSARDNGDSGRLSPPARLAVFWPIRAEPDFREHYLLWSQMGFELALPVTPLTPGPLNFYQWEPGEELIADTMGIQTPASAQTVCPDLMLIPCVGFGRNGLRLGYGGGYYDRSLVDFDGLTIGVAYSETRLPDLVKQAHDCLLGEIITEPAVDSGASA